MTQLYINNNLLSNLSINGIRSIEFFHTGQKTYSAITQEEIWGSFISNPIYAPDGFLKWNELTVSSNFLDNVFIYTRSDDSDVTLKPWTGPLRESVNDISFEEGQLVQFLVLIKSNLTQDTQITEFKLSYITSQDSKLFFTKSFNLGFCPENLLITYNATKSDDSILKFFVSGKDSILLSDYQEIDPNKINKIKDISQYSEKIKIMVELAGDSSIPIELHEIGLMFDGNSKIKLNKEDKESSSSESSESQSSHSSSSSSSIDSSSSSSEDYSSSSSSSS